MKKQSFLVGSMVLVFSVFVCKILGLLFKIPLANILGGTGMGYFSCAYAIFMPIYAVSVTGLPAAVSRMVAENMAFERYANVRKIKRVAIIGFSAVGIIAAAVIIIFAKPFAVHIVENENAYAAIVAIAPSVYFGAVMSVYRGYYEGLHNMTPTALSQVCEAVVKLFAGLGLSYLLLEYIKKSFLSSGTVFGTSFETLEQANSDMLPLVAAAAIAGVTLSSLAALIFLVLRNKIFGDGITKKMLLSDTSTDRMRYLLKDLMKLVFPIAVGSIITNLTSLIDLATIIRTLSRTISSAPEFFIENFKNVLTDGQSLEDLPNFIYGSFTGIALTIFNLVPSLTGMFGKGVLPNLAESWATGNQKGIDKSVNSVISLTSLIAFPSGLGIFVLAEPILRLLYSSRENEITVILSSMSVLGIGVIFLSLSIPVFSMLQAIGRADLPIKIMVFGVIIKFFGNITLMRIPEFSVSGAAISTVVCYAVICFCSLVTLKKLTAAKVKIGNTFLKPLFGAILCSVTAYLGYDLLFDNFGGKLAVIFAILAGGTVYFISLLLMNISAVREFKAGFFK